MVSIWAPDGVQEPCVQRSGKTAHHTTCARSDSAPPAGSCSWRTQFEALEKQSYAELKQMITEQKHVPEAVFELFLSKIYKRRK